MFAIRECAVDVNGRVVDTFCRTVREGHTSIVVEAGTSGYLGGDDRESGGRTYVSLFLDGDFMVSPVQDRNGRIAGMEISLCGDGALDAMMKALDFARTALDDQRREVDD